MLQSGDQFGKYRILRQIGRGSMGIVYLAEDGMLLRKIALKVLDKAVTCDPQFEDRFLQEARTVAQLKHPNIVQIHSLAHIEGDWAIEMPYVEGGSLADAEARGLLTQHQTLQCVRDVLLALAVCHESEIIHRDIKPSNILLDADQRGLLSDFGLAKLMAQHQMASLHSNMSSSFFIGTPRYAPPESWEEVAPTPAWDLYSTGMVLYEAVAGATPYTARTPLSLMKQMLEQPIPVLKEVAPAVSDDLSDLVGWMLAREPERRPQDAADVLERFWALPEYASTDPSPPVLVKPLPRHTASGVVRRQGHDAREQRKKRLIHAGVGLAVLALLSVVGLYAFQAGSGGESAFRRSSGVAAPQPQIISPEGIAYSPIAFDSMDMQTQQMSPGHVLAMAASGGAPWRLLAATAYQLWLLEAVPQADGLWTLQGSWADYDRQAARMFRSGAVNGKGRWVRADEEFALSLGFVNALNGAQWDTSLILKRSVPPISGAAYLQTLESAEALPSLIFNELLPRGLPWFASLESFLEDLGMRRLSAARLPSDAEPFVIDGYLAEPAWRVSFGSSVGDAEAVLPSAGREAAMLRLYYDDQALYIGACVAARVDRPRILAGLQTAYAIPPDHAPRWMVQMDGSDLVAARRLRTGRPAPWDCTWKIAHHTDADRFELEMMIPFVGLSGKSRPEVNDRWRVNLLVGEARPDGTSTIALWGHAAVEQLEHGITLRFEE